MRSSKGEADTVQIGPAPSFLRKSLEIEEELGRFKQLNHPATEDLPAPIARLVEHIHENLFDAQLNVSTAKNSCDVHNNNVTTYFKVFFGVGIREYIEIARIEAACWLLSACQCEAYLVAMAVGYSHPETFCRAFLRRTGTTPMEFREVKKNRQEESQEKDEEGGSHHPAASSNIITSTRGT